MSILQLYSSVGPFALLLLAIEFRLLMVVMELDIALARLVVAVNFLLTVLLVAFLKSSLETLPYYLLWAKAVTGTLSFFVGAFIAIKNWKNKS